MVLEIQLFLIHAFQKVVAPCFRELGPHKSRKNSCSSGTTQRIKTRLVLLHWRGPVHPNDIGIVSLMCSLGCPQRKTTKIYCPINEVATHSTFQRHPSAPKAAMVTIIGRAAAGSCSSPVVQKSCRKMLQRRNRKRRPKIHNS